MKNLLAAAAAMLAAAGLAATASADEHPEIKIAVDNLWPTMDPVIGISTTGARVHSNVFDTLVRRNRWEDPDGTTLVPWLAESWERTTPNVWTIKLREGVTFHDGHEMDAEDVAFSMSAERLWGPSRSRRGARGTRAESSAWKRPEPTRSRSRRCFRTRISFSGS